MTKARAVAFIFMVLVSVMPSSIACGYCPPPKGSGGHHGGGSSPPKTPKPPSGHVPTPTVPAPKTPKPPVVIPPPKGGSGGYPPYTPKPPSGGSPKVPTPSVPTPSIPTPSVPTPTIPTPSVPTPTVPTPSNPKCPKDALKLGACVDLLGGLVHVFIGDPVVNECCPVIQGLAGLEAALCLCTTIRAKVLNLNVYLPLALQLIASCGLTPPEGFKCPEAA